MFKRSRLKLTAVMMGVLFLLFTGTVCVIYLTTYSDVFAQNQEMLERYAKIYRENGNPAETGEQPPSPAGDGMDEEHIYRLSSFYSVLLSETGEAVSIDNDTGTDISNEELTELAEQLSIRYKRNGVSGHWVYLVEEMKGKTLVVLMDNTIMRDSIGTLLKYTALFGSITAAALLLLSFFFARYIVRPLEESYQKQKQFISDAGHELKTPIAVINANLELLERETGQSKWLDNVKFENSRMSHMVNQLLALARAESAEPVLTRLDLSRIVAGGILPFESIAFETRRELETEIQDGIHVMGNQEQLGSLVSILMDNAISYAPECSVISVMLKAERGRAVFTVSNEGKSIPEEQREKLFDRFYRLDPSRSGETPHYGLGLAIAKSVVNGHHGKISVSCKGSLVIFRVSLPVSS